VKNSAVSTSGDVEQYLEINGKRYSHLIDPRTGQPLTNRVSVTVIAETGALADPLTKVGSVLGADRGLEVIGGIAKCEAMVVSFDNGKRSVRETKGFDRFRAANEVRGDVGDGRHR
jgi:thiamine biosynthesis lipoprotein